MTEEDSEGNSNHSNQEWRLFPPLTGYHILHKSWVCLHKLA
uniref:Uncharacterized protein n=1 Tax=Rhizophora mucronata TaxID=61149 RepID=A0A2P2IVU4_RHIMU